jgi:hypothetical protein
MFGSFGASPAAPTSSMFGTLPFGSAPKQQQTTNPFAQFNTAPPDAQSSKSPFGTTFGSTSSIKSSPFETASGFGSAPSFPSTGFGYVASAPTTFGYVASAPAPSPFGASMSMPSTSLSGPSGPSGPKVKYNAEGTMESITLNTQNVQQCNEISKIISYVSQLQGKLKSAEQEIKELHNQRKQGMELIAQLQRASPSGFTSAQQFAHGERDLLIAQIRDLGDQLAREKDNTAKAMTMWSYPVVT